MKTMLLALLASAALAAGATAETPNRWGAIALNMDTRGVGIGWNFPEQWKAEDYALKKCGRGKCKVLVTNNNGCGALAVDFQKKNLGRGHLSRSRQDGGCPWPRRSRVHETRWRL